MLHELLLALVGRTGNIIIERDGTFIIDPKIDFISDPEKDILNKICTLGFYYMRIQKFKDENHKVFSDIALQLISNSKDVQDSENVPEQNNVIGNSAYIKAFCYGIEEIMEEYGAKILEIERTYLKERVFTLSALSVKLSDYFYILPEIAFLIDKILSENCKGGQVVDLLQAGLLTGNAVIRDMYKKILKHTYKVLFHQIIGWIVYGKLIDFYNEFFIYKVENKKSDITHKGFEINFEEIKASDLTDEKQRTENKKLQSEADWNSAFSLRFSMLPQSIISVKLAENILFIGKAQRVLQLKNKSHENFSIDSLKILQQLSSSDIIDTLLFQKNTIEKIRFEIAQKLMHLMLKEEKLLDHLQYLKQYYFLEKGEFYQIFIEESRNFMKLPPNANTEYDINGIACQNAIVRLGWDDSKIMKNVRFKITNNGFEFNHFSSLHGLNVLGNVTQKKNHNYIRFEQMKSQKESGCMWYNIKQSVENGFEMSFSIRFKRALGFTNNINKILSPRLSSGNHGFGLNEASSPMRFNSNDNKNGNESDQTICNCLCLVIQNGREIASWKKNAPTSLKDLQEYVALKITLRDKGTKLTTLHTSNENYQSSIGVYYYSKEKGYKLSTMNEKNEDLFKEKKLGEVFFNNDDLNFAEEDLHLFKIKYDGENLTIFKDDYRSQNDKSKNTAIETEDHTLKVPLKLAQLLNLDMGRAYVGFVQESTNGNFFIDVLSWKMLGHNIYNNEDSWNGLTVTYNVKWPLDLLLSNQVMEKYSGIFRFLFPIKCIQTELHQVWLSLIKKNRRHEYDRVYLKMLHLRNQMSFFIDNLWSYFHVDVISVQWTKLEEALLQAKDFEELRKIHDVYLASISNQIFLSFPKMVKGIFTIVQHCKKLAALVSKAEIDLTIAEIDSKYHKIREEYEQAVADMLGIISILNKNHNSPSLFQLLLRLDYNNYYSSITNEQLK